jgi:hypothetical protein
MSNYLAWPPLPDVAKDDPQAEVKKLRYEAELEIVKARLLAEIELEKHDYQQVHTKTAGDLEKAYWEHENALDKSVHDAYIEAAKGDLERRAARADFVQKSAAAIGTTYTAVLALSFAVAKDTALPIRGIVPTIFLGLAIVLATAYVAFITRPTKTSEYTPTENVIVNQALRRNAFVEWVTHPSWQRSYLLNTSVISLGTGIIFLPSPYLSLTPRQDFVFWSVVVVGVAFIVFGILWAGTNRIEQRRLPPSPQPDDLPGE